MKKILIGLIVCLLFPVYVNGEEGLISINVESDFPEITRGDRALATAKEAGRTGGVDAEGQSLLQSWSNIRAEDEEMDQVAFRLIGFAKNSKSYKENFLKECSSDQIVRLCRKCVEKEDYKGQKMLADEYLNREIDGPEKLEIMNIAAKTHVLLCVDNDRALELWDEVIKENPETLEGVRASIYAEAMRGPESIAALEAAHEIGYSICKEIGNPFKGIFMNREITDAAEKDFFKAYITNEEILPQDRAELIYKVLYHAHQGGQHDKVPDLAGQIFTLVGYEGNIAEKAAYMLAFNHIMKHEYEEAVEEFFNFIQTFPDSLLVRKAYLYIAHSFRWNGQKDIALLHYKLTMDQFPNTKQGKEAAASYNGLLDFVGSEEWVKTSEIDSPIRLAALQTHRNAEEVWSSRALPLPEYKVADLKEGNEKEKKEQKIGKVDVDRKYMRFAELMATVPDINN